MKEVKCLGAQVFFEKKSCEALNLAFVTQSVTFFIVLIGFADNKRVRMQSSSDILSKNEADDFALVSTITFNLNSVHFFYLQAV